MGGTLGVNAVTYFVCEESCVSERKIGELRLVTTDFEL